MEWAKVSAALEAMATAPSAPKRRSLLSSLLKQARASGDVYAVMRILLPKVGSDSLLFFSSFSFFSSPRISSSLLQFLSLIVQIVVVVVVVVVVKVW
jgi:hypothetical protein